MPFSQTDWTNPRAPAQPLENRGFLHNASVQLIGQDQFFGAPGQAQTYDWPNPLQPRRPAQADNQSNLLVGLLAVPFAQTDWPNPRATLQLRENRGFTRGANVQLVGQDRFFGALGQAPAYDYPNPLRPRYPIQPEPPPDLLTTVFSVVVFPFAQTDWPNPREPKQPQENRGFLRNANVQLIGLDQFFGAPGQAPIYDWPNPPRPRYPIQPEQPPNPLATHAIVAAPFYQTDWPNPLRTKQPQENQGFLRNANVQLIGLDQFFAAPGEAPAYDWPNPLRPRYPVQPESPPNFAIIHTVVAAPFYQLDWPNPQTPKQPQENRGFIRAANVQLIGIDQFFYAPGQAPVYDWPNPIRPRYPVQPEPPLVTIFIPPTANLIPDFVFVEPTRRLVFSLIAAPYPPTYPSAIMAGVGQLGIDVSGNGEQVVAAWDAKLLPEILAGGTLLSSPAPTIQQVAIPGQPALTFSSIQISGTQIQAIVSVTGGNAGTKYPTLAKVFINNASTWRYVYGDVVLIGPN